MVETWKVQTQAADPTLPPANTFVEATVEEAVARARAQSELAKTDLEVLVTGSLHLVGNTMTVLGRKVEDEFF
jgi:folylpolyglutamate synthase/dihydropteroate synthase